MHWEECEQLPYLQDNSIDEHITEVNRCETPESDAKAKLITHSTVIIRVPAFLHKIFTSYEIKGVNDYKHDTIGCLSGKRPDFLEDFIFLKQTVILFILCSKGRHYFIFQNCVEAFPVFQGGH
jgi:hypothetical protein